MTCDKVKIDSPMMMLSIPLASIQLSVEANNQERTTVMPLINKMVLFSKNAKIGKKIVIKVQDKLIPKIDQSIKHKNYQPVVIIPINNKEPAETARQFTTESIRMVQLG